MSAELWHADRPFSLFGKGIYLYDMDWLRLVYDLIKADLYTSRLLEAVLKPSLDEMK